MIIENVVNGIRYTLTNESIENGNKVYPIGRGRCLDDGGFVFHELEWDESISGFPSEPHVMLDTKYSEDKAYQVRTNEGYGPIESYFRVIKKEHQVYDSKLKFARKVWVEIK